MTDKTFLKPAEFYQREIDPINQYIEQTSFYLSKMKDRSIEDCKKALLLKLKDKRTSTFRDPEVHYMERDETKDTFRTTNKLSFYINETIKNKEILTPTFTTYLHPNTERSLLVDFIDRNVKIRNKSKKESFVAKANKDINLFITKNNEQNNMKAYNNSMSGSFAANGSPLKNPTAHSTLTSITRTEGSLGNASNEKIIAGNRHYKDANTTLSNIIFISSSIDRVSIQNVINEYNLYIPTIEDVNQCIKYSSELYWKDPISYKRIADYVDKLDDLERAAVVYTGDLYHIRKHNDKLVRVILSTLSKKVTDVTFEDPTSIIKSKNEQVINFAHQICSNEVKGIGKKYHELSLSSLNILAGTCVNIQETVNKYFTFFDYLFLTKSIPASTAYIPAMLRRSVVLSDTDSTMFSVDEYISWYYGKIIFNEEAFALACSVMFIATQCIAHTLAVFSANLNVERSKLFSIAMKPEFSFPVFAQTPVAKHYFTCIAVQEGDVHEEMEIEIKGVHLKNSAAPKSIIRAAHAKMKDILARIHSNEKISMVKEIKDLVNIENMIKESLLNNKLEFYKQSKIKAKEAYSREPELSPYLHHMLWEEVFQPKYGTPEAPPYGVIKIPTTMINRTLFDNWLAGLPDREFADRFRIWMDKHNKVTLPTMYVSVAYVKSNGIPKELMSIINIKKIVLDLTVVNRMILETLGFCPKTEWLITEMGY